jgi:hypothetical protein
MSMGDSIYDHVTRFFRDPVVVTRFELPHLRYALQILGFDRVYARCRVHVSLGLSRYADVVGHTAEVYVPAEGFDDELPEVVAAALFRLVTNHRRIERGIAIPFGDVVRKFAEATNKSSLYITNPFGLPDDFSVVRSTTEKKSAHMFLGLLITTAEQRLIDSEGHQAFEGVLESRGIDPFDIARPSVV